jgi:hypothetical protein
MQWQRVIKPRGLQPCKRVAVGRVRLRIERDARRDLHWVAAAPRNARRARRDERRARVLVRLPLRTSRCPPSYKRFSMA